MGLYLGKEVDAATGALGARLELDPRDLLTHGLIVGMTGSGKTGLAIVLIEEVLRQGIPVLAIDPKGDLGNLLLLFEDLSPASFAPWIDREAARRAGQDPAAAAKEAAEAWRRGLAEWGLGAEDVARLARSREAVLYTPGSKAGRPLNVLQSLEAPSVPFESAEEDLRDEITGIVAGLLGLVGIEGDPLRSRESILLSQIIESAWRGGRSLSLETLITSVAEPSFDKLGALSLETVFPRRDREKLMLALNNLLASSAFEAWREGEPLDVERLLHAADGRPRLSIVTTSHLSDQERLFVTALLLDKVKTWMRRQGGTSGLRALVYMDEIYGYFPPHPANPPSKRPLLALLKQARAQGVGVVLATQNPVDLDYKGLANMGVWLVGKLQTAQDRDRLKEGLLETGLEAGRLDLLLDATRQRVFLLHDVHRPGPTLLQSRWAMSYLRGPLTREEISQLRGATAAAPANGAPAVTVAASASTGGPRTRSVAEGVPVVPAPFEQAYLKRQGDGPARPHLLVKYAVRYPDGPETVGLRAWPLLAGTVEEALEGEPIAVDEKEVATAPPAGMRFGRVPEVLAAGGARAVEKALKQRLADKLEAAFWFDPVTKAWSRPGEDGQAFAERLSVGSRDARAAKLEQSLEKKRRALAAAEQELSSRKVETWTAVGTTILSNLGLFTGRKRTVSGAGTVVTKNRMENSAEARVAGLKAEVADLEAQVARLSEVDPARLEERRRGPEKGSVKVLRYELLWVS